MKDALLARELDGTQRALASLRQPESDLPSYALDALYSGLPFLRGYWPLGGHSTSGPNDLSGRGARLTYHGNPLYSMTPYTWLSLVQFDGAGDYLNRVDEAELSITGTEAYIDSNYNGLTFGAWAYMTNIGAVRGVISKWDTSTNDRSYTIYYDNATGVFTVAVSTDGTAVVSRASTITVSLFTWYFIVGRFKPSTELSIYVNGTWSTLLAGVPASIYDSAADLEVGADDAATRLMQGWISRAFLCAGYLPDELIAALFARTRSLYGV